MPPKKKVFRVQDCLIPTVYCGKKKKIPKTNNNNQRYVRRGTRSECLRKGVGAGVYSERDKHLSNSSLQRIMYVGPYFEQQFRDNGIRTINGLIKRAKKIRKGRLENLLEDICTNRDGRVDRRTYNSVVLHIYKMGITWVPNCRKIRKL
jgi:hypothetical protein